MQVPLSSPPAPAPDYSSYLISHSSATRPSFTTQYTINRQISPQTREIFLNWTVDQCSILSIPLTTGLLACHYIDIFLHKKPGTQLKILELVGITALVLACKFKDNCTITPNKIKEMMGGRVSLDAILTTEIYFLEVIGWELFLVTSADLVESICECTIEGECEKVLSVACRLAALGYCDWEIACCGKLNSAIASIILCMRQFGFGHLKEQWVEVVREKFEVDFGAVLRVVEKLEEKLKRFS